VVVGYSEVGVLFSKSLLTTIEQGSRKVGVGAALGLLRARSGLLALVVAGGVDVGSTILKILDCVLVRIVLYYLY